MKGGLVKQIPEKLAVTFSNIWVFSIDHKSGALWPQRPELLFLRGPIRAPPLWRGLVFIPRLHSLRKLSASQGTSLQEQASPRILPPNGDCVTPGPPLASPPHAQGALDPRPLLLAEPAASHSGTCQPWMCHQEPGCGSQKWRWGRTTGQRHPSKAVEVTAGGGGHRRPWQQPSPPSLWVPSHPNDKDKPGPQPPASTNRILQSLSYFPRSFCLDPVMAKEVILSWNSQC